MPLYIFEPRYRQMLDDVLDGNRMFALVMEREDSDDQDQQFESMCPCATVGIIRASHRNDDGTSNLVLQGIARAQVLEIVEEHPYRIIRVQPVMTDEGASRDELEREKIRISRLLERECLWKSEVPKEFMQFLLSIDDPDAFLDLTIHSICQVPQMRQALLETYQIAARYQKFRRYLHGRIRRQRIFKKLQGRTTEEEIGLN